MDLSKAFDTINHDLLIAKLHCYGIKDHFLKLLWNYLKNRWQCTKINATYSSWAELLYEGTRGIYNWALIVQQIHKWYFFRGSICNFAVDTTPHASGHVLKDVRIQLEHDSSTLPDWFRNNSMTLNEGKCHLLVCGHKDECMFANIGSTWFWEEHSAKFLGIHIDTDLSSQNHVRILCKSAGRKISTMARIAKYLSVSKRKLLMKTFFESLLDYCPLIWMFCGRTLNKKINTLHEQAL